MMRRFFWLLVVLFISVWTGMKISQDPGYALFVYRQWSVEMPLWFAFLAAVAIIYMLYFLLRFSDAIEMMWLRFKNWLRVHRKYKSYGKTNRGMIELLEGDWRAAEYYLTEGLKQSDTPLVNYIAAAKAANEQGAYERRDLFLQKARDLMPGARVAIGLTQAQLQLSQGQVDPALLILKELRSIAPKHKLILKLLEKLYIRLANWNELLKLLPALRKAKLVTPDQQDNFEAHLYQELLNNNKTENLIALHELWKMVPKKAQKNPDLIICYVKKLLPFAHSGNEAEELLANFLRKQWNEEMVYLYGIITTDNAKDQLAVAEGWLKQYGYRATLFLTLGKLCMRCQLWGKARSYFEQSLKAGVGAEGYLEYGKLLEHLGESNAALINYRFGLSTIEPPQL